LDFCLCTTKAERSNKMSTTPTTTRVAALSFAGPFFRLLCCNNAAGFIRGIFLHNYKLQSAPNPSLPPSLSPISLLRSSKHQLFMKNRFWQLESNGRIHLHIPMSKSSSAICFEMKGIPKSEPRVWRSTLGFATEYGASEAESWQHNWKELISWAFYHV
jgi:hypothetical protein